MSTSRLPSFKLLSLAAMSALLVACGGSGDSGSSTGSTASTAASSSATVASLANICTVAGEKAWISAYLNDVYLFYRDIVAVDPNAYATPEAYFSALLVTSKDRFSFVEPQSVADAFFNQGQDIGFGAVFKLDANNALRIGYVNVGGPLAVQNVARGAQITTLNGTAVGSLSTTQLNALLFPTSVGTSVTMGIVDAGQTAARTVTVASTTITEDPVPLAQVIPASSANASSPKIGYMLFNDHIATSENELINAIASFKAANVSDVVIDLRYNGGGFLYIASELAYMLGGTRITAGAAFEKLLYNDKHPEKNSTQGFQMTSTTGQPLPTLSLPRVFVITAPGTCSASESVINGLTPFISVIRIGGTTCGKPYGFVQANNCADAFFAIQFQGVNNVDFGAYTNGFAPTCTVADDFGHQLGDPLEGRLAATLAYQQTGSCPASSLGPNAVAAAVSREGVASSPSLDPFVGRPDHRMTLIR